MSHVDPEVVEDVIHLLNEQYGKEKPISVHCQHVHDYLGMQLDFSQQGKVVLSMIEYIKNILADAPDDMQRTASTLASTHLFDVNLSALNLDPNLSEKFHHVTTQLLYLCKQAQPDIQMAVAYLCTHVSCPDLDDWKKLGQCIWYLCGSADLPLTLKIDNTGTMRWWNDASFAVHQD